MARLHSTIRGSFVPTAVKIMNDMLYVPVFCDIGNIVNIISKVLFHMFCLFYWSYS